MRFGVPGTQADYFERDSAIETFLMGTINYALTASPDFLQQFVVANVCEYFCCSLSLSHARYLRWRSTILIPICNRIKPER